MSLPSPDANWVPQAQPTSAPTAPAGAGVGLQGSAPYAQAPQAAAAQTAPAERRVETQAQPTPAAASQQPVSGTAPVQPVTAAAPVQPVPAAAQTGGAASSSSAAPQAATAHVEEPKKEGILSGMGNWIKGHMPGHHEAAPKAAAPAAQAAAPVAQAAAPAAQAVAQAAQQPAAASQAQAAAPPAQVVQTLPPQSVPAQPGAALQAQAQGAAPAVGASQPAQVQSTAPAVVPAGGGLPAATPLPQTATAAAPQPQQAAPAAAPLPQQTAAQPPALQATAAPQTGPSGASGLLPQLKILIIGAKGLRAADYNGKSDPYCVCHIGPEEKPHGTFQTPVIKKSLEPTWNSEHLHGEYKVGDPIKFVVFDEDLVGSHDLLGNVTLHSQQFYPNGFSGALQLEHAGKAKGHQVHAFLSVKISVMRDGVWHVPSDPPAVATGATTAAGQTAVAGTTAAAGATQVAGSTAAAGSSGAVASAATGPGVAAAVGTDPAAAAAAVAGATVAGALGAGAVGTAAIAGTAAATAAAQGVVSAAAATAPGVAAPSTPAAAAAAAVAGATVAGALGAVGAGAMGTAAIAGTAGAVAAASAPASSTLTPNRPPPLAAPAATPSMYTSHYTGDPAAALSQQQEKDAARAVESWRRHWHSREGLRSDLSVRPLTPQRHAGRDRMFMLRMRAATELVIPLALADKISKSRSKDAQAQARKDAETALSVRFRMSFIRLPAGGIPEVYGQCMTTPKLTPKAHDFLEDKTQLGKMVVNVVLEQPLCCFFHAENVGPEYQLIVEVLAEAEPAALPYPVGHSVADGEIVRVQADGWRGQVAGGVAFTVELKATSGSIPLYFAPNSNGELVRRNSLLGGVWGSDEVFGGWPFALHGGASSPFVLDFKKTATQWEVFVDGRPEPDFNYAHRASVAVTAVVASQNLLNPRVLIIPTSHLSAREKAEYEKSIYPQRMLQAPPRLWQVHAAGTGVKDSAPAQGHVDKGHADKGHAFVPVGWACIRFDNAVESRKSNIANLGPTSLRDWLLKSRPATLRGERLRSEKETPAHEKEFMKYLETFLVDCQKVKAGSVEYDLEKMPGQTTAQRLMPPDSPAMLSSARLGGIASNMTGGRLELRADTDSKCRLIQPRITFQDERWLETVLLASLEYVPPASIAKSTSTQHQKSTTAHQHGAHVPRLRELRLRVGTNNSLRWLDVPPGAHPGVQSSLAPGITLDETLHMYQLVLTQVDARSWASQGAEVPLEFACDSDCALVLELAAAVTCVHAGKDVEQVQTVAWLVMLPLRHTTEAALHQAVSGGAFSSAVQYNLLFRHELHPPSGHKPVWEFRSASGQPVARPNTQVSFGLVGERFIQWLYRKQRAQRQLAAEMSMLDRSRQQSSMSTSGLGQSTLVEDQITKNLLQKPTDQTTEQMKEQIATANLLYPQTQPQVQPAVAQTLPPQQVGFQPAPIPAQATQVGPAQQFAAEQAITAQLLNVPPPGYVLASAQQEVQTVVERIYLRDQATQSDPPAIPGTEDNMIGEGKPINQATLALMLSSKQPAGQPYAGQSMHPITGRGRAQFMADLGDTLAGKLLQGIPATRAASTGPRRELHWRLEDEDPLSADEFVLEFLAYRSLAGTTSERIHFQLRFFVFPPLKTASAVLAGGPGEACLLRSAVTNERLALTYSVDGATRGAASEVHRQLVEYLAARDAEIEIWNSDAAMQVGVAAMSLEGLVRQRQPVAKVEVELPVLDPMTGEARGTVQALLTCRGQQPAQLPLSTDQQRQLAQLPGAMGLAGDPPVKEGLPPVGADRGRAASQGRERGRVRHKASALMNPTGPTGAGAAVGPLPDEAAKKQQRLQQLQRMRGSSVSDRFSDHTALLSAAEEVRADRKRAEVARRMDRFNTSQKTVYAPFANSAFFHVEFENPYTQQAAFTVTVFEPKRPAAGVKAETRQQPETAAAAAAAIQNILEEPPKDALALIKDPEEWRRIVAARKVPPPPGGEYRLFTAMGHFALRPREVLCLPFRYLAFDHPGLTVAPQAAPVGGLSLAEVEARPREVEDRCFIIEVAVHQGPVLKRIEVTARAQPCVVDRTIRFFEVEGTPIEKTMALPPRPPAAGYLRGDGQRLGDVGEFSGAGYLSASLDRLEDRYVYCTDREVHLQWKGDDALGLRLLAPMSPGVKKFFVLCYADPHFLKATTAQLVEVHALKTEHVRVSVGQSVDRNISLPPVDVLESAMVQAYSSDPECVAVQPAATVDPRYGAKLGITVSALQAGTRTCRLHAVDPATRRRLAAFLIVIAADLPDVRMVHDITLPLNMPVKKALPYKNEAMRALRYTLRSSDPAAVQVCTPELLLPPGDTRVVELLFHAYPATMTYNTEVFLFIASEDRAIQETRLLQLTYT